MLPLVSQETPLFLWHMLQLNIAKYPLILHQEFDKKQF